MQHHACTQSQATYSPQSVSPFGPPTLSSMHPAPTPVPAPPQVPDITFPFIGSQHSPAEGAHPPATHPACQLSPLSPGHRQAQPQRCSGVEGFSASPPQVTHLGVKAEFVGSTCSASGTKTASSAPGAAAPPPAEPNPAWFSNIPEHSYWGGRGQSPAHQQRLSPRARDPGHPAVL